MVGFGWTRISIAITVLGLIALSGCGGSSSSGASQAEIEAARKEGETAAHEKDRVDSLQKQVRNLKKQAKQGQAAAVAEPASNGEEGSVSGAAVLRTFHAPSGNVSCEILENGALCTVDSIETTFAFDGGDTAHIESGAVLPRGAGQLVPYGNTVGVGAVSCAVPLSSEARGVTCVDEASGHGFEASRVGERQKAY